ncbi:MAG: sigma 54-interacting transcriptional regulator [Fibrobacterota bacterium]
MNTLVTYDAGREAARYPLKARLINIGRSSQCDLVLDDGTVSTLHANILARKDGHQLVDLDSTNGTFLNGSRVEKAALKNGDVIGIGKFQLKYEEGAAFNKTGVTRLSQRPAPLTEDERRIIEEEAAARERGRFEKKLSALEAENTRLLRKNGQGLSGKLLGKSAAMQRLFMQSEKAAASGLPVLITGETGTGKSALARHIHALSPFNNGEFIVIDCASIPPALLESELFGHEKGAFTGAVAQKQGRIELAHKGTLFLDEIGDMAPPLQAKLLRVLQEKCFERVGGTKTIQVEVRLIAATNRDLKAAIAAKGFREDLYYRICGVQLFLPPLRDRADDLLLMAHHFLEEAAAENGLSVNGFSPDAKNAILHHRWEGNVRELKNTVQSAVVLCQGDTVTREDLGLSPTADLSGLANLTLEDARTEMEKKLIRMHLNAADWNYSKAAKTLDIDRGRLARYMEKYGIEGKKQKDGDRDGDDDAEA